VPAEIAGARRNLILVTEPRREFERELEAIEANVIQLFAMVGEDLAEAAQAFRDADGTVCGVLIERDREIDILYRHVEELVQREILLQAPVASDLRFLLSVLRITPELERSHDLIVEIAAEAGSVSAEELSDSGKAVMQQMGDLAVQMWGATADCWYQRDGAVAKALAEQDRAMNDLHATMFAELAAGGMTARATMELTLVTRYYRRLSAHALNIARRVVYLAGPARD
jgi:phosphate transport system protein